MSEQRFPFTEQIEPKLKLYRQSPQYLPFPPTKHTGGRYTAYRCYRTHWVSHDECHTYKTNYYNINYYKVSIRGIKNVSSVLLSYLS